MYLICIVNYFKVNSLEENSSTPPLGKIFSELAKAYASAFTERLTHLPIKRYYYALVVIEAYEGNLNQTLLADELYIDKASVVRMLDYLESEDCIVRKQNPQDRRAHILELTPKARGIIPAIKAALHETNTICLAKAAALGIHNLEAGLNQICADLQSEAVSTFKIHFVQSEDND
jgi:MarR family transcriptional regulator, transcriptional regulator for hemolysin